MTKDPADIATCNIYVNGPSVRNFRTFSDTILLLLLKLFILKFNVFRHFIIVCLNHMFVVGNLIKKCLMAVIVENGLKKQVVCTHEMARSGRIFCLQSILFFSGIDMYQ